MGSPWQTKVIIIPMSRLVHQWVLLGLLLGIWMRGFLQKQKWLKDQSPLQHGWQLPSWGPRSHCLTYRPVTGRVVLSRWFDWSEPFPGRSVGLCCWAYLKIILSRLYYVHTLGEKDRNLENVVSFKDSLKLFWIISCSILEETLTQHYYY